MRIKVCQIIPTLVQGGAEKQMALLAAQLDPERFESSVVVLTHSGPLEEQLRAHHIPVHFVGKRGKFDPFALRRLVRMLREIKPDVVHTWLFAANSYGRIGARRAKVPVIIAGERCVDTWKKGWNFFVDQRLLRITDAIVTNTAAVAEFYAGHGIPQSRFTVIPNAIVSPQQRITRDEFFQRLNIKPRGKIVGAVGRLWKQKGYRDLIWSSELLRVAHQDVWVVIVGDGPERERLLQFRDQAGAQDALRFVGHRQDAVELMSAFDLLWNGSEYEGQSNTILEAMSLGIPVVASDIPGNRDLIRNQENGFLFPLGDVTELTRKSNLLLQDDDLRRSMGQAGARIAQQEFSLELMVSRHEELYEGLFKQKRLSSPQS
jgi:glycosyltransferase involved in cell wall biosynthesis